MRPGLGPLLGDATVKELMLVVSFSVCSSSTEAEEQRLALRHSIALHLAHPDASEKSVQLPILHRRLYVYALWKVRITWELMPDGNVTIWSITLLKAHRP
jgi:hypothetical protein